MTLGNSDYFGELELAVTETKGCGSEIRGVLGGGYVNPARVNYIQYVTLASASNAIDFGDLTVAVGFCAGFFFNSWYLGWWIQYFTSN